MEPLPDDAALLAQLQNLSILMDEDLGEAQKVAAELGITLAEVPAKVAELIQKKDRRELGSADDINRIEVLGDGLKGILRNDTVKVLREEIERRFLLTRLRERDLKVLDGVSVKTVGCYNVKKRVQAVGSQTVRIVTSQEDCPPLALVLTLQKKGRASKATYPEQMAANFFIFLQAVNLHTQELLINHYIVPQFDTERRGYLLDSDGEIYSFHLNSIASLFQLLSERVNDASLNPMNLPALDESGTRGLHQLSCPETFFDVLKEQPTKNDLEKMVASGELQEILQEISQYPHGSCGDLSRIDTSV